jgi:hypothetical protein
VFGLRDRLTKANPVVAPQLDQTPWPQRAMVCDASGCRDERQQVCVRWRFFRNTRIRPPALDSGEQRRHD